MMCGRLIGGVIGGKVSSKAQLTAVSVVALVFVLLGIFAPIDTMGRMPVFTGTGFAMIEVPIGVMFLTRSDPLYAFYLLVVVVADHAILHYINGMTLVKLDDEDVKEKSD